MTNGYVVVSGTPGGFARLRFVGVVWRSRGATTPTGTPWAGSTPSTPLHKAQHDTTLASQSDSAGQEKTRMGHGTGRSCQFAHDSDGASLRLDLGEPASCGLDLPQALDLRCDTRHPQRLTREVVNKTSPLLFYKPKHAAQIGVALLARAPTQFVAEVRVRTQDESAPRRAIEPRRDLCSLAARKPDQPKRHDARLAARRRNVDLDLPLGRS
jgi:hypothetical protein